MEIFIIERLEAGETVRVDACSSARELRRFLGANVRVSHWGTRRRRGDKYPECFLLDRWIADHG